MDKGFSRHHIMSSFKNSGIWPPDRQVILSQLRKKQNIDWTPRYPDLMPYLDRFAGAKRTSTHIRHRYHDVLSSPTRQNIVQLDEVVNEAILMKDSYERTVSFAAKRRQKAESTMIRRAVKPLPGRLSVSHADIANAVTKRIDEADVKERKRQKRLV